MDDCTSGLLNLSFAGLGLQHVAQSLRDKRDLLSADVFLRCPSLLKIFPETTMKASRGRELLASPLGFGSALNR